MLFQILLHIILAPLTLPICNNSTKHIHLWHVRIISPPHTHRETHRYLHGMGVPPPRYRHTQRMSFWFLNTCFLASAVMSLKCPVFIGVRGANKASEQPVRDNEQISGSGDSTEGKCNNKPIYKEKATKFKVAPNHLARQWLTTQKFSELQKREVQVTNLSWLREPEKRINCRRDCGVS